MMKLFIVLFALVAVASADVSHLLNTEYLPPHQGAHSAPAVSYSAPAATYHVAASAPVVSYSAPAATYHVAESAPAVSYSAPAAVSYSAPAAVSYSAPAATYETYQASAPTATFSASEGYRYKTNKRSRRRHRRDVSTEYLPPVASYSAPAASYAAPAAVSYSAPAVSYSAPAAVSYSAPAAVSYSAPAATYSAPAYESYEVAGTAPAHSYSAAEGYRYKTQRRRVVKTSRRHRN
ncbi:cuticle protein 16.5-like [Musca domestica]|uniref:Cuticle protein 16.5-like n=1 Tax=Musca domestica TaxID=7370 RepID=A0A1I8NDL4_MUSDO|nr:cuticle protein 16.5-like [Musca domestica]